MMGALLVALVTQQFAASAGTRATEDWPDSAGTFAIAQFTPAAHQSTDSADALAARVEIYRTEYGVPHILADDLKAMGFGLGYVQSEDYSASIAVGMIASRGTLARHLGADELDADFVTTTRTCACPA